MERVINMAAESVRRYFDSLFKFGYKNYNDVDRLLVLTYLEELLSYGSNGFLTEEDYRIIINGIYCLGGSTCIIDFPSYATYDSLIKARDAKFTPRRDEDGIFRLCESSLIRTKM